MKTRASQNEIAALIRKLFPVGARLPAGPSWSSPSSFAPLAEERAFAESGLSAKPRLGETAELLRAKIAAEIDMMRRLRPDSLALILPVIPGTELFLRLTNENDQIRAFGRCEQGDFGLLQSLWTELQPWFLADGVLLLELERRQDLAPEAPERAPVEVPAGDSDGARPAFNFSKPAIPLPA